MAIDMLRLEILPPSQRRLWDELADVPDFFTLYGGTAIALYLGHRESVDFDFFGSQAFNPQHLYLTVPFLKDAPIIQQAQNTLTCLVDRAGPIQVSFLGVPKIHPIKTPCIASGNGLKIASIIDLAGTKAAVVQQRAEAKDYIDLATMIERKVVDLPTALSAARLIYPAFNPELTLKALSYYGEGSLDQVPETDKIRLVEAVRAVDLDRLPVLKRNGSREPNPRRGDQR